MWIAHAFITSGGKRFTFRLCLINLRVVDLNKFSKLIIKLTFTSAVNYEIILINRPKCLVVLNYFTRSWPFEGLLY
ncbi:MAG: hypothetical protein ACTS4X_00310 [Candidatus Hodgkinia cicadicola]